MRIKSGQNVVTILPDRFEDNQPRVTRYVPEDVHPMFLALDEAMPDGWMEGVSAADIVSGGANGIDKRGFSAFLGRPTLTVGGRPQVAARDQDNGLRHSRMIKAIVSFSNPAAHVPMCNA